MKVDAEDQKFQLFSEFAIRKIGGIRHCMMSELETGLLLGRNSRYVDANIDLIKISSVMSHIFSLGSHECETDLKVSINEFGSYRIFSTRSSDRVISLVADNQTQVGLIRMLIQKYYQNPSSRVNSESETITS
jgi:hypothetical protein